MSNDKNRVFIYWDTSNIFIGAQDLAEERKEGPYARFRVRVYIKNMLRLAHADRPVAKAVAAGSVPPEIKTLWNKLEMQGVEVRLFDRGGAGMGEQEVPDRVLQLQMLEDGFDNNENPGTVVLLTGDGKGFDDGVGFHSTVERLHKRGWQIEIMSWSSSCNQRMRKWVEDKGVFINLDDHYKAITFLEPLHPEQGQEEPSRPAETLDLSNRTHKSGS
ncbi:MAG: NYN domain-containing protein [Candidatus Dadabacteria bacterium]|nr:NYN domain-containing protein [Candidatus Dadabacteria bacterium]